VAGLSNPSTTTTAFNTSMTLTGLVLGGGFEYAFWKNVSLGFEYAHTFYGGRDIALGTTPAIQSLAGFGLPPIVTPGGTLAGNYRLDTDEVVARLNWRWAAH
jgi:opacity protein-like surface antigen